MKKKSIFRDPMYLLAHPYGVVANYIEDHPKAYDDILYIAALLILPIVYIPLIPSDIKYHLKIVFSDMCLESYYEYKIYRMVFNEFIARNDNILAKLKECNIELISITSTFLTEDEYTKLANRKYGGCPTMDDLYNIFCMDNIDIWMTLLLELSRSKIYKETRRRLKIYRKTGKIV